LTRGRSAVGDHILSPPLGSATLAEAATIRSMDNPVGGEIHQKNDRF
jgi:hypothetical protein